MDKKDFSQWEEEIKIKVEKSINSIEFDKLGRNIERTVNKTMEQAINEVKKAWSRRDYVELRMDEFEEDVKKKMDRTRRNYDRNNRRYDRNMRYRGRQNANQENQMYERRPSSYPRSRKPSFPVASNPNGTISGVLYEIFGGIGVASFGFSLLIIFCEMILGTMFIDEWLLSMVTCLVFTVLSGVMLRAGIVKRRRVRRFKKYVRIMDGRCHYPVEKLAAYMGQKKEFIVKDLDKMIDLGMFPEGHFDDTRTDFILDHQTYELYLETMMAKKQREEEAYIQQQQEQEVAAAKAKEEQSSTEQEKLERILTEGNIYIKKIRECNDKIPGDVVSAKLFKLENITNKIFEHIRKCPSKVEKIEKFMEYYLPTTLKLVTTYQELDSQPVAGDNIKKIKAEIEETLDTINTAFEKLLDSLFEDEMFDISSDISVLETVLKQEGLAESDFVMSGYYEKVD